MRTYPVSSHRSTGNLTHDDAWIEWGSLKLGSGAAGQYEKQDLQSVVRERGALETVLVEAEMMVRLALGGLDTMEIFGPMALESLQNIKDPACPQVEVVEQCRLFDLLIEQMGDVAVQSGTGELSLLHSRHSCLNSPFLRVGVRGKQSSSEWFTTGMAVSPVRDTSQGEPGRLIGLYAVHNLKESRSSVWLHALMPWLSSGESVDRKALVEEINRMEMQLRELLDCTALMRVQLATFLRVLRTELGIDAQVHASQS